MMSISKTTRTSVSNPIMVMTLSTLGLILMMMTMVLLPCTHAQYILTSSPAQPITYTYTYGPYGPPQPYNPQPRPYPPQPRPRPQPPQPYYPPQPRPHPHPHPHPRPRPIPPFIPIIPINPFVPVNPPYNPYNPYYPPQPYNPYTPQPYNPQPGPYNPPQPRPGPAPPGPSPAPYPPLPPLPRYIPAKPTPGTPPPAPGDMPQPPKTLDPSQLRNQTAVNEYQKAYQDYYREYTTVWYPKNEAFNTWNERDKARKDWESNWKEWVKIRAENKKPEWAGDISYCCSPNNRGYPACQGLPESFFKSMCLQPKYRTVRNPQTGGLYNVLSEPLLVSPRSYDDENMPKMNEKGEFVDHDDTQPASTGTTPSTNIADQPIGGVAANQPVHSAPHATANTTANVNTNTTDPNNAANTTTTPNNATVAPVVLVPTPPAPMNIPA